MKPSDALKQHRDKILEVIATHSLRNPRVFGSVSRGEDTENSDLDILLTSVSGQAISTSSGQNWISKTLLG
jgi:predicted nucleotidyltransferase